MTETEISNSTPSTTDVAITRCETIIRSHSKQAKLLFVLILAITYVFVISLGWPVFSALVKSDQVSSDNVYKNLDNLVSNDSISIGRYDTIITKAIALQKLRNESLLAEKTKYAKGKSDAGDFILYAVFVLIFGVLTSLYRFHLKEISRQEHYLLGFQRIRIAAVNSTTKYDNEVKIALTENAFPSEIRESSRVVKSPIEGHPALDFTSNLLNKILDKFDLVPKK